MKSYLNPQPYAVDRADKSKFIPSKLAGSKANKLSEPELNRSAKEIFKTESEEQAWRDVLP